MIKPGTVVAPSPGQGADSTRQSSELAALLDREFAAISGAPVPAPTSALAPATSRGSSAPERTPRAPAAPPWVTRTSRTPVPAGPGLDLEEHPLPASKQRTEAEKAAIGARISPEWLTGLHTQIADLYGKVTGDFINPPANAEKALGMLREARQLLVEQPEEYASAEYRTAQVRAMLERAIGSRTSSRQLGPRIFAYEFVWLIAFVAGLIFAGYLAGWIGMVGNLGAATMNTVFPAWNAMMWGGVGGVVGSLYHLWWHVAEKQDFDGQYMIWYLVQPVMGLILGGILYLVLASGFLVLQVNLSDDMASAGARLLPYLTAVLAGFRQNFVYEQFDRMIALFTPGKSRS